MEAVTAQLKNVVDYWLISDRFSEIQGFLDPIEGYALLLLAAYGPGEGCVVEIGSLYGRSTCYLATGCARNGRGVTYAVDTFAGSPEHQKGQDGEQADIVESGSTLKTFLTNIARHKLDAAITPIRSTSRDAAGDWNREIRLLFIDGDHSYEESKHDFEAWSPHVVPAGIIAFHDVSTWPGVTRFYEELLAGKDWTETLAIGTLRVVTRSCTP